MPYFPLLINADILTVVRPNPIARLKVRSMRSSQASWPGRSWVVGSPEKQAKTSDVFLITTVKMLWVHANMREGCFGEGKGLDQMVQRHLHHIYESSRGASWSGCRVMLGPGADFALGGPKKLMIWSLGGRKGFAFVSFCWCGPLFSCVSRFFNPPPMFLSQTLQ